jgi:formylmethanofuran--tetrahydromethanopterin N-formyltransferase
MFGDGYQTSKLIGGKRYWRIPVMDGDFLAEDTTGMVSAIGGGNFLVLARSQVQALTACEAAMEAMRKLANVIMPFPGGVVRSGSKVGSKYPQLRASTNDPFCPTIKGATRTHLSAEIASVLEIVVDDLERMFAAMRAGIGGVSSWDGRAAWYAFPPATMAASWGNTTFACATSWLEPRNDHS